MEERTFAEIMDRSYHERLEGEVHLFCRELEDHGYDNIDIVFALMKVAHKRINREKRYVAENFHTKVRDMANRWVQEIHALDVKIAERIHKGH